MVVPKEKASETRIKNLGNHYVRHESCPKCGKSMLIYHENGWQFFNRVEIIGNKMVNRSIAVRDCDIDNQERDTKLKNIVKCILCPEYRRSLKLAGYVDRGYTHQEALARVGVVEII